MPKKILFHWTIDGLFRGIMFYFLTQFVASHIIIDIPGYISIFISFGGALFSTITTWLILKNNNEKIILGATISLIVYICIHILIIVNNQYFHFDPFPNRNISAHESLFSVLILTIYLIGTFVLRLILFIIKHNKKTSSSSMIDS